MTPIPIVAITWLVKTATSSAIKAANQVWKGSPLREAATRLTMIRPGRSSSIHECRDNLIRSPASKPTILIEKAAKHSTIIKVQWALVIVRARSCAE